MIVTETFSLRRMDFSELRGWGIDDPRPLFAVMRLCLEHIRQNKPYRTGSLGLTAADLLPLLSAAIEAAPADAAAARAFFEAQTVPFLIERTSNQKGFVTAFYEPEVEVSDKPDSGYRYPFYRRPADLVDLDDANRPQDMDASYVFGRNHHGQISPYFDRRMIDEGCLDGQGLEIAWAKSKIDVFFAHVQGAARLRYPDGRLGRITYAAKAGHPFSAIGKLLIDRGEIDPARISMQSIRAWLAENPAKVDDVLWRNRSYIFFREAAVDDPSLGPIAAAKVPLVAGRSLAVDRLIHTFGFPFFIRSETLTHLDEGRPFARLMMALDTGSAIVGPARGDIFTGSGDEAGELAGTVRNSADFHILIPKAAAPRFAG
ncbi:murein transglycosylase A [Allorhizobium pseudoryzae]|uniref:murein transglycosylase A n=1 Tax=Allorhizobium pseudoryzae TaxID=379684 RepID=UPI003D03FAF0